MGKRDDRTAVEQEMLRPNVYKHLAQAARQREAKRAGPNHNIQLVVLREHIVNAIFWDVMITAMESHAKLLGCDFSLTVVQENGVLSPAAADGFLILGGVSMNSAESLIKSGKPVVWVDGNEPHGSFSQVRANNRFGAYMMTKHAIELGHRRILFLQAQEHLSYVERFQGVKDCVGDYAYLGVSLEYMKVHTERDPTAYAEFLSRKNRSTFVFACCDAVAIAFRNVADQMMVKIPEDLSLAGFDNLKEAREISSVDVPKVEMGILAVEALLRKLKNPFCCNQLIQVEPTLMIRGSIGSPPAEFF